MISINFFHRIANGNLSLKGILHVGEDNAIIYVLQSPNKPTSIIYLVTDSVLALATCIFYETELCLLQGSFNQVLVNKSHIHVDTRLYSISCIKFTPMHCVLQLYLMYLFQHIEALSQTFLV